MKVNQIWLARKIFFDFRVVEKVMISMMDRFERKINAIEESCEMSTLTFIELISKLQA